MRVLAELEALGYTFSLTPDGKLHYRYTGAGAPPEAARELLRELKRRKEEAVRRLASRQEGAGILAPHWDPQRVLKYPVLIGVTRSEWQKVLGRRFWLAPNEQAANRIREKHPGVLVFTARELAELYPDLRDRGPQDPGIVALITAKRMFAGTVVSEVDTG